MCTSSSSDGSSAGSDGAASSTPFLATWNGSSFVLENDFLFGKPNTNRAHSYIHAKKMYESNLNQGDKYLIQNKLEKLNNKYVFQIKEIEPEVSSLDYLSVSYFYHNKNEVPVVTSDHKNIYPFSREDLKNEIRQVVIFNKKEDISSKINSRILNFLKEVKYSRGDFYQEMLKDEILEIEASGIPKNQDVYLLLESKFRDWTLGEILKERDSILSSFYGSDFKSISKLPYSIFRSTLLIFIFVLSYMGFGFSKNMNKENESILSQAFDVNMAHADVPPPTKSLRVDYLAEGGDYKNFEIIEPRYYQASMYAIKIPAEAMQNGTLSLRISATKKHHVTCAYVISSSEKKVSFTSKKLQLSKAYHRRLDQDFSNLLSQKNNEYVVTWPGDIIDIEFKSPTETQNQTQEIKFLLEAGGFYNATPRSIQIENQGWISRLDSESLTFLQELEKANKNHPRSLTM